MRPGIRCSKASAWITLITLWFACLAPTLALAFPDGNASQGYWTQLCTMNGSSNVWIDASADDGSSDSQQASQSLSGHCLFCSHATALGPPPADVALTQTTASTLLLPRSYFHAPRPLFSWAAHRTRGPPIAEFGIKA